MDARSFLVCDLSVDFRDSQYVLARVLVSIPADSRMDIRRLSAEIASIERQVAEKAHHDAACYIG